MISMMSTVEQTQKLHDVMRWHDLTDYQKNRLAGLIMMLEEFAYGFDQSGLTMIVSNEMSAAGRFYSNSLHQYFSNIFLVQGSQRTSELLKEIECEDLVESIEVILSYKVGAHTLRYVLRAFRDKHLVHTNFDFDQLAQHLGSGADLSDAFLQQSLSIWIFDLFSRTRDLYESLSGRFPEVVGPSRSAYR